MREIRVSYTGLAREVASIKHELLEAVESVLESGRYVNGPHTEALEQEFAAYCGTRCAVAVSCGTSALLLVYRHLGIGPGDEVITAPNSFVASASTIALVGARPVFVDVGRDMNLDPDRLEAAITPRTRAILPVHLTGRPVRMPDILEIARRHDLLVIEDAAQAVGASLNGSRVGSLGVAGCFSLHPLKNLHAFGDGGVITTDDSEMQLQLVRGRSHGLRNRDTCDFWSYNARLDEVQAAMLRVQLRRLESWTDARRRLALGYNDLLRPYVAVPDEGPGERHVYQTYMVQAEQRDALHQYLNERGVEALIHYARPIHLQPVARYLGYTAADFPVCQHVTDRILSLPLYPELTQAEQDRVVELIAAFYGGRP